MLDTKMWRIKKRFTQKELARKAQISTQAISYIENERYSPPDDEREDLASALGVPVEEIDFPEIEGVEEEEELEEWEDEEEE